MLIMIGIVAALSILAVAMFLAFIWRRVVPTNMVHIVQSSKKTVSYGRGRADGNTYYAIPSFIPIFGVTVTHFPESIFDISLRDYEAYDTGRLPFVVDIKAFFRIADSQIAAQRVANFTELQGQLMGVLQGAVRGILGNNKLENIMQDRSNLGEMFTKEVNDQLQEWGVTTAKMIEFMDIRDSAGSQVIQNMMAKEKSRIEKESRVTVADNIREAEMKEIEAKREIALTRTQAEQQVGIREAEAAKEVGIAKEKSNQEVQTEAKITTEKVMEVQKVQNVKQAEIERDVAAVKAEQDKQVQVVNAQATKESQIIKADAEKESTVRIADGNLQATLKQAEGIQAEGLAKAEAEKAILLAPVNAQLTLAKEIGENQSYQAYLIEVRKVEATEAVGKEMAQAMREADLKVIANSGSVQNGVASLGDIFTPAGGTSIAGMLEALGQTDQGKALIGGITSKLGGTPATDTPKAKKGKWTAPEA
jgi:flotillin